MRTRQPEADPTLAQKGFNTVTLAVGGLYLATHSVIVTLIGTAAAGLLACWALWVTNHGKRARADIEGQPGRRTLPTVPPDLG